MLEEVGYRKRMGSERGVGLRDTTLRLLTRQFLWCGLIKGA